VHIAVFGYLKLSVSFDDQCFWGFCEINDSE